jgi:hypothetical protein
MPPRPKMPPMVVATMVLRAWRREVAVARALVSSSNFEDSISVRSFPSERVAHPGAKAPPGVRTVVPSDDRVQGQRGEFRKRAVDVQR